MDNKKIIGELIGLSGAIENNGKRDKTDEIIKSALMQNDNTNTIEEIKKEKFTISPNCEKCPNPCGNTSYYDIEEINSNAPEIIENKKAIIEELTNFAHKLGTEQVPDIVFKALYSMKYELSKDYYDKILEELRKC